MFTSENKYLFLIIAIFIAACIETDIFLPAMVDMMHSFSVSEDVIQGLLTWNFVGICIACPLYGPIADSFGRQKPLYAALGLFFVGSLMTVFATEFTTMLIGRFFQGLGSGGCFTLGTAIIFDRFPQEKATLALNKINSIIPFIMAAAPLLGGYLNNSFGYRSNFLAIAFAVFFSLVISALFFKETLPKQARVPLKLKSVIYDFRTLLFSIPFLQTTVSFCLIFAGYISFLSTISLLYVTGFDVSKQMLPFFQGALLGSWLVANLIFKRVLEHYGIKKIKTAGLALLGLGVFGFSITCLVFPENPYMQTALMSVFSFGANWTNGIYFPEAMSIFPDKKGISASIMTCARLLFSALMVYVISLFYNGTIYPAMSAITVVTGVVMAMIISYERSATGVKLTKSAHVNT